MKIKRPVVEIDEDKCNGCGLCVPSCHEGAIQIINGKAKLVGDNLCDGLGACLGECPQDAIHIVEREADAYDEEAVKQKQAAAPSHAGHGHAGHAHAHGGGGCPGSAAQQFARPAAAAGSSAKQESALSHWPVQIRLISPAAPYLEKADLLVTADCVPVACGSYHQDFLSGRIAMVGCPKFDDMAMYTQKFADIFAHNDINSVTVMVMQVPCCQGLPDAVADGLQQSGKHVPIERVVISLQGDVLERCPLN